MRLRIALATLSATGLSTMTLSAPLAAETSEPALVTPVAASQSASAKASDRFAAFTPETKAEQRTLDYQYLDEALDWLVLPMGPSIREGAPRVEAATGTRRIFGHKSRYRLEGNRVAFNFMSDEQRTGLTDYRRDLERIGTQYDVSRWPRNEQLAFWMNLHNVAVLEALAKQYPLSDTRTRSYGEDEAGLHEAKLVKVKGVPLSLRDIREEIVYPNWRDPKVIYGFWRGEIGGPSLARIAYTGRNVDSLLSWGGEEFVNSLRGVEKYSGALRLSKIYEEAMPFFFNDADALRTHLSGFARDDVKALIEKTDETRFKSYDYDVADLIRGHSDPGLTQYAAFVDLVGSNPNGFFSSYSTSNANIVNPNSPVNPALQRLINERANKLNKAIDRGLRTGTVIVGEGEGDDAKPAKEVK